MNASIHPIVLPGDSFAFFVVPLENCGKIPLGLFDCFKDSFSECENQVTAGAIAPQTNHAQPNDLVAMWAYAQPQRGFNFERCARQKDAKLQIHRQVYCLADWLTSIVSPFAKNREKLRFLLAKWTLLR